MHIYTEPEEKKASIKDVPFTSTFKYRTLKDVWEETETEKEESKYWMEIEVIMVNFNIVRFG